MKYFVFYPVIQRSNGIVLIKKAMPLRRGISLNKKVFNLFIRLIIRSMRGIPRKCLRIFSE